MLAPAVFQVGSDDRAEVLPVSDPGRYEVDVRLAVERCPNGAIAMERS